MSEEHIHWKVGEQRTKKSERTRRNVLKAAAGTAFVPVVGAGTARGQLASLEIHDPDTGEEISTLAEGDALKAVISSDNPLLSVTLYVQDSENEEWPEVDDTSLGRSGDAEMTVEYDEYADYIMNSEITFVAGILCGENPSPLPGAPDTICGTATNHVTLEMEEAKDTSEEEEIEAKWAYPTEGRVRSSPIVADGTVYVGSNDGNVYALDAETGGHVWHQTLQEGRSVYNPTVVDGTIYIGCAKNVYAINAETGESVWGQPFQTGHWVGDSLAVAYGMVYVGSKDGNVYAIDAETGEAVWDFSTGGSAKRSPTVADGTVYVGGHMDGSDTVQTLDAETGEPDWSYHLGGMGGSSSVRSSPTVVDDTVYVGSYDNNVYAIDTKTGDLVWNQPFQTKGWVRGSPAVADSIVYVGSYDNNVYAIDTETGDLVWNQPFSTDHFVGSSPAVADSTVYVGSNDHNVYAIDAETGEAVWDFSTGDIVQSNPTVVNNTVYVGSHDNKVYALG